MVCWTAKNKTKTPTKKLQRENKKTKQSKRGKKTTKRKGEKIQKAKANTRKDRKDAETRRESTEKMDDWRTHTEEGRSLERVWYIASREPSDTPPDRNYFAFAPKGKVFTTPYTQGFQVSLSLHPPPLGEFLSPSNQRSSKTSQACYDYPRCNLDRVRLFRFSPPLPIFRRLFLFPRPRDGAKPPSNTLL